MVLVLQTVTTLKVLSNKDAFSLPLTRFSVVIQFLQFGTKLITRSQSIERNNSPAVIV